MLAAELTHVCFILFRVGILGFRLAWVGGILSCFYRQLAIDFRLRNRNSTCYMSSCFIFPRSDFMHPPGCWQTKTICKVSIRLGAQKWSCFQFPVVSWRK